MYNNEENVDDEKFIGTVIKISVANKKFLKALSGMNGKTMYLQLDEVLTEQRKKFNEKFQS